MPSNSDSTVAVQPDASGSAGTSALHSNAAERSSAAAIDRLTQQLAETNVHLLVLTDQTAKCLAHISLLLDLLVSEEDSDDASSGTYLDGTPIS
jgi:hypothetical protein